MSTEIKKTFGIDAQYDKKSADFLSKALNASSGNGFDYINFRQSIKALNDLELDESTAFKSAFATAKTLGVSKTSLVSSAKQYLSILMDEKSKFDEALGKRVQEKVASKKEVVHKLENNIEEMKRKVSEMQKRIADMQAKIDSADEDVEKEKQKIEETKNKFEHTFNAFTQAIKDDIAKVSEHL